jgi:hypothetical protein
MPPRACAPHTGVSAQWDVTLHGVLHEVSAQVLPEHGKMQCLCLHGGCSVPCVVLVCGYCCLDRCAGDCTGVHVFTRVSMCVPGHLGKIGDFFL